MLGGAAHDSSSSRQDHRSISRINGATNGIRDMGPGIEDSRDSKHPRRKRKHEDDLEDRYLTRLAREEASEAKRLYEERVSKRRKSTANGTGDHTEHSLDSADEDPTANAPEEADQMETDVEAEDAASPPPQHETLQAADLEVAKANRTVFLSNVSTAAISSKQSQKVLLGHLKSFFDIIPPPNPGEPAHKIESLRFRSTPYASTIPKKAAYATKQLMDATTKCTNAYCVYSAPALARQAAKRLNATVVLDRHLRVDEVAHPAKVDNKRCVFIGNLGFVDDETNINAANAEDGYEKRKPGKQPADIDEGLWRTFGKCGAVESVRVIRDSTTRVGKGVAYVQFHHENAVEEALLLDGKKFPPMLPRKLRVARAKAPKRNARPGSGRPSAPQAGPNGYRRKITGEESSQMGRAGKLFGRAAAVRVRKEAQGDSRNNVNKTPLGVRRPEDFIFEGHRATFGSGKAGLKLGGRRNKGTKPTGRSAKRAAAFKQGGKRSS